MTREEMMELKAVVRRTMEEEMEMYSEVWLTDDELCKVFGTLKPAWLDRYWTALYAKGCARQPGVKDEKGVEHSTSRLYARNKIQRLFVTGEIEKLECKAVVAIV
jgi:hypothetical protein